MVDAVGVEIFGHILETAHPPGAVVTEHLVPVVGGEAPVLSVHGEVIGRCTGLSVEVEIAGFHKDITARAVHADGNVALQDDALAAGIGMRLFHLHGEHELHIVVEFHIQNGRMLQGRRRTLFLALHAIFGIGDEPLLLFLEELLVFDGTQGFVAFLFEEQS